MNNVMVIKMRRFYKFITMKPYKQISAPENLQEKGLRIIWILSDGAVYNVEF